MRSFFVENYGQTTAPANRPRAFKTKPDRGDMTQPVAVTAPLIDRPDDLTSQKRHPLSLELARTIEDLIACGVSLEQQKGEYERETFSETGQRIIRSSERLQRRLSNLLLFQRLENRSKEEHRQKRIAVTPARCPNPGKIINSAAFQIGEKWQRDLDLTLDTINAPIFIHGQELYRIAYELVDNAFKYSPMGSSVAVGSRLIDGRYTFIVYNSRMQGSELEKQPLPKGNNLEQPLNLGISLVSKLAILYGGSADFFEKGEGFVARLTLSLRYDLE